MKKLIITTTTIIKRIQKRGLWITSYNTTTNKNVSKPCQLVYSLIFDFMETYMFYKCSLYMSVSFKCTIHFLKTQRSKCLSVCLNKPYALQEKQSQFNVTFKLLIKSYLYVILMCKFYSLNVSILTCLFAALCL